MSFYQVPGFVGASANNSLAQSISWNTNTALTFNTNLKVDGVYTVHSTSVNPTRFTAPVAGFYAMAAWMQWATAGAQQNLCELFLFLNATTAIAFSRGTPPSGQNMRQSVAMFYHLNAGDFIEATAYQDVVNATALNTVAGQCGMSMYLVGTNQTGG